MALLLYAMNGIRAAEKEGRIPVINFEPECNYRFYAPERGENIWDYYFEPPEGITYAKFLSLLKQNEIHRSQARWLSAAESTWMHSNAPDRIATFWNERQIRSAEEFFKDRRREARCVAAKYIRATAEIRKQLEELDSRVRTGLPRPQIGVHIRGTDLNYTEPVATNKYFREIRKLVAENNWNEFSIYLATDQQQFVEEFCREFGTQCVATQDCTRGSGSIAPFKLNSLSPWKKGQEALLDLLMMSQSDVLVKGPAGLGEGATWFSKSSTIIDLSPPPAQFFKGHKIGEQAAKKLGLVKNKQILFREKFSEFIERHLYLYAPNTGFFDTVNLFFQLIRRWLYIHFKGFRHENTDRLMLNICPYLWGYHRSVPNLPLPEGRYSMAELIASGELSCPLNIFMDGWVRGALEIKVRTPCRGKIKIHGINHLSFRQKVYLTINKDKQNSIKISPQCSFKIPVRLRAGLNTLKLRFSKPVQLDSPDDRVVTVVLQDLEYASNK